MSNVIVLGYDDLHWPLGVQETAPEYLVGTGDYQRHVKIDPYPCYPHELERVEITLNHCIDVFPLNGIGKFGLWLLCHDFTDRINGITFEDTIYRREDGSEWEELIPHYDGSGEQRVFRGQSVSIVLAAKRIPIMPAMTRYLVPHEYGHAVFNYVARRMGYKDHEKSKLEEAYMEVRGVSDFQKKYRGGFWHLSPGEIIANDFRVLFTKQEMEFWPHSCPLPAWSQPEGLWWKQAAELCGVKQL
jgi:hypothetical protein